MRTLSAPIRIPPPPEPSRLCCSTSEDDVKFGEAEIHVGRRDEQTGIPASPKLKITVLMHCRIYVTSGFA